MPHHINLKINILSGRSQSKTMDYIVYESIYMKHLGKSPETERN
jgi:hypothetical protein